LGITAFGLLAGVVAWLGSDVGFLGKLDLFVAGVVGALFTGVTTVGSLLDSKL
jgi:hypothetical protein